MFVTVAFCRCSRCNSSAEFFNKYRQWTVRQDTYDINYKTFLDSIENISILFHIYELIRFWKPSAWKKEKNKVIQRLVHRTIKWSFHVSSRHIRKSLFTSSPWVKKVPSSSKKPSTASLKTLIVSYPIFLQI